LKIVSKGSGGGLSKQLSESLENMEHPFRGVADLSGPFSKGIREIIKGT